MFTWLHDLLQAIWSALKALLIWLPDKLFSELLQALTALLSAIPVPDFINNAGNLFSSIPPSVMFWLEPVHLGTGITIIITANLVRFFIRRIPFIG